MGLSTKYITLIMIVGYINTSKLLHPVATVSENNIAPANPSGVTRPASHHPYETLSSNKREVYFETANRDSYVETRAAERRSREKFAPELLVANPVRRNLRARRSRNTRKTLGARSREEKLHRRCVPRGFHLRATNELAKL